mmetsp:Transcript_8949/g.22581  ORF Transcript_8949/g.22581 Transcript_8949/m.22581 type:complete len:473 (+) Transcript_8949:127-1545(+)
MSPSAVGSSSVSKPKSSSSASRMKARIINYHMMFRVRREDIIPRPDSDILPDLASKETFVNAIMSHPLHGPWYGTTPEDQDRPAIHCAISTFNDKRKELFYSSGGKLSESEAWDAAVAEMDDRLLYFLHGWYGKDQFTYAKCGPKLNFYSNDSTTNHLLFDNHLVPFDLSHLYDKAIDALTEAVSSSEGTKSYNEIISQHLNTLMKNEYWLNDSPSRFGARSACVRGSWMYALVLKNYPNYISNNVNNFGSTDQNGGRSNNGGGSLWPTNFGNFSIGSVVNSWWNRLTGQQTLKLEIPSSTTNNKKTDPRGVKRTSETPSANNDEENAFGKRRLARENPPTKRRRTSTGFVGTTPAASSSTSKSTSCVPTSVSIKPKKHPDVTSMTTEDDDMSETSEIYSDFWDSKKKKTTTTPKKKKKTTTGQVSQRTRSTRTTPSPRISRSTPKRRSGCEHMSNVQYRQFIHRQLKKKNG